MEPTSGSRTSNENTVSEIEASSGTVIRTIPVGSNPRGVSSDGTHVWVTNEAEVTVSEIEASSGEVIRTIPVGDHPDGVSSDGTHVWVTNAYTETVSEIEASSGDSHPHDPRRRPPLWRVFGWNTRLGHERTKDTVSEIEASSGKVIRTIPVGAEPRGVSSDGTHVWVTN